MRQSLCPEGLRFCARFRSDGRFFASVPQDEAADAVFSAAVSDFISGFNAVYRADHGEDYLLPIEDDHWVRLSEPSLCFGYDAVCFQFAADREV